MAATESLHALLTIPPTIGASLSHVRGRLRDTAYRGQQLSLAVGCGLFMRIVQRLLLRRPPRALLDATRADFERLVTRHRALLDADLANVEAGVYPSGLLFQLPLGTYARALPELLVDAPLYVRRHWQGRIDELPPDVERASYPHYYLRNFHGQTDGWLSDHSATIYDLQVELLFGGTADVMRRMALPPVITALRGNRDARVLDVACGTGRFLGQLQRALPASFRGSLEGIDLSPHYVERARKTQDAPLRFSTGNAESLPLASSSVDVVCSIFLFHELPSDARRNVVREALRVLKPAGTLVLLDAAQLCESPDLAFFLTQFAATYHEPYFKGYLKDDLAAIVASEGFESVESEPFFVSKRVVARKPRLHS